VDSPNHRPMLVGWASRASPLYADGRE
jgi:hypothetical protein